MTAREARFSDDANFDPQSGGMRIWNEHAPSKTKMSRYNAG